LLLLCHGQKLALAEPSTPFSEETPDNIKRRACAVEHSDLSLLQFGIQRANQHGGDEPTNKGFFKSDLPYDDRNDLESFSYARKKSAEAMPKPNSGAFAPSTTAQQSAKESSTNSKGKGKAGEQKTQAKETSAAPSPESAGLIQSEQGIARNSLATTTASDGKKENGKEGSKKNTTSAAKEEAKQDKASPKDAGAQTSKESMQGDGFLENDLPFDDNNVLENASYALKPPAKKKTNEASGGATTLSPTTAAATEGTAPESTQAPTSPTTPPPAEFIQSDRLSGSSKLHSSASVSTKSDTAASTTEAPKQEGTAAATTNETKQGDGFLEDDLPFDDHNALENASYALKAPSPKANVKSNAPADAVKPSSVATPSPDASGQDDTKDAGKDGASAGTTPAPDTSSEGTPAPGSFAQSSYQYHYSNPRMGNSASASPVSLLAEPQLKLMPFGFDLQDS